VAEGDRQLTRLERLSIENYFSVDNPNCRNEKDSGHSPCKNTLIRQKSLILLVDIFKIPAHERTF
jgi:hypothetical protein